MIWGPAKRKKKTETTLEAAKGPKVSRNGPNMVPSWSQIGPKMVQKWSPWPPKTLTIAREVLQKSMFEALRQNLWPRLGTRGRPVMTKKKRKIVYASRIPPRPSEAGERLLVEELVG